MFVRTVYGGLINVHDIVSVTLMSPKFEQKKYIAEAYIRGYGTRILFEGTEEECENYINEFENKYV